MKNRKVILNTELVRAVSENGKILLYIRMANGQWAVQRPYDADLRGQIGALTLAIDALAGKIILTETIQLDEREFKAPKGPAAIMIEATKPNMFRKN